jgi:hypothetical protein
MERDPVRFHLPEAEASFARQNKASANRPIRGYQTPLLSIQCTSTFKLYWLLLETRRARANRPFPKVERPRERGEVQDAHDRVYNRHVRP